MSAQLRKLSKYICLLPEGTTAVPAQILWTESDAIVLRAVIQRAYSFSEEFEVFKQARQKAHVNKEEGESMKTVEKRDEEDYPPGLTVKKVLEWNEQLTTEVDDYKLRLFVVQKRLIEVQTQKQQLCQYIFLLPEGTKVVPWQIGWLSWYDDEVRKIIPDVYSADEL